jgi:hypothetical protein
LIVRNHDAALGEASVDLAKFEPAINFGFADASTTGMPKLGNASLFA